MLKSRIIPNEYFGLRLDKVLALLFPDYSRAQLSLWFKAGRISIQPPFAQLKDKVHGGEAISYRDLDDMTVNHTLAPQAEAIALNVVFEDAHCLVLNKPAGLIAHPGAGNPNGP